MDLEDLVLQHAPKILHLNVHINTPDTRTVILVGHLNLVDQVGQLVLVDQRFL